MDPKYSILSHSIHEFSANISHGQSKKRSDTVEINIALWNYPKHDQVGGMGLNSKPGTWNFSENVD